MPPDEPKVPEIPRFTLVERAPFTGPLSCLRQLGPNEKVRFGDKVVSCSANENSLAHEGILWTQNMYRFISGSRPGFMVNEMSTHSSCLVEAWRFVDNVVNIAYSREISIMNTKGFDYSIWRPRITIIKHKWQTEPLPLP